MLLLKCREGFVYFELPAVYVEHSLYSTTGNVYASTFMSLHVAAFARQNIHWIKFLAFRLRSPAESLLCMVQPSLTLSFLAFKCAVVCLQMQCAAFLR